MLRTLKHKITSFRLQYGWLLEYYFVPIIVYNSSRFPRHEHPLELVNQTHYQYKLQVLTKSDDQQSYVN